MRDEEYGADQIGAYGASEQPAVAEAAFGEGGLLRQGNRHVEISGVRIGTGPSSGATLTTGHPMTVDFDLTPREPVDDVAVSISATDVDGVVCFAMSSALDAVSLGPLKEEQSVRLELHRLDLTPGEYTLEIGVYSPDYSVAYDLHSGAYRFEVVGSRAKGIVNPPRTWRLT